MPADPTPQVTALPARKSADREPSQVHHERGSIEAHLTIVLDALRDRPPLQDTTDVSTKKQVRTLRLLRSVQINVGGHIVTAAPQIIEAARHILDQPTPINAPRH